jgi:hypothetical protein
MNLPVSVEILREQGAMNLMELTRQTAMKMKLGSVMYADVESVLEAACARGEVTVKEHHDDRRLTIWEAVPDYTFDVHAAIRTEATISGCLPMLEALFPILNPYFTVETRRSFDVTIETLMEARSKARETMGWQE